MTLRFSDPLDSFKPSIDTASWGNRLLGVLEHHENRLRRLDEHLVDPCSGNHLRREDVGVMDLWQRGEESAGVGHQRCDDRSDEMRLSLRISGKREPRTMRRITKKASSSD